MAVGGKGNKVEVSYQINREQFLDYALEPTWGTFLVIFCRKKEERVRVLGGYHWCEVMY